ncbi:MAG: hypothetical protein MK132_16810 [Lentisphaerales bacterium]|nr:hypothetical protein [Lentisphaerales bacterium]
MSVDPEDQFIEKIISTVEANGYPEKKVSLPLAKVKGAAESRGLDLDMILSRLGMKGFYGNVSGEKLIFSETQEDQSSAGANPFANMGNMGGMADMLGGMDLSALQNMSQEELMEQVSNLMGNMTPEQQQGMMDMYQNMSDEEKEQILNKGKDMGLFNK